MSESLSPEIKSDMKSINTVDKRSANLVDQSKDAASNLHKTDQEMQEVQTEGVLTENEQNDDNYTEQEFQAMSVEDKKAFLSELQTLAKEKNSMFVLEIKKNKKEGQLFKLAMAYSETEEELRQKMEVFKEKKALIEAKHEEQTAKATEKYEKDNEQIKSESKNKIIELARELKKNPSVEDLRIEAKRLDSSFAYFGLQKTAEIGEAVAARRDGVKEDSNVASLIDQISVERGNLDAKLKERKEQLVVELASIEQGTKSELSQLKSSTLAEVTEIKQQLTQIEQDRDKAEQEFTDLEAEIEDKQRLQSSIDLLKDELRDFGFADGQKIMADLENRAANTLSMESLSADKESFESQLNTIINSGEELEKALDEARQLAEQTNNNSYSEQLVKLVEEKDGLRIEKENSHNDLVKELNEPFALAIEKARATSPEELREGTSAIELVSLISNLGGEVKKAEKSINKSARALNKFLVGLEKRFSKLQSKLDAAKRLADNQVNGLAAHTSEKIFTAQTIAEQAKEGDFSQVAGSENWLKKTFSKLFAKR
jgi:hypothetical protein